MNHSKKVLNSKTGTSNQVKKHSASNRSNPTVLIAIAAVCVLALVVGLFYDMLRPKYVLTVNDEKYTKNDLMYYFYTVESAYQQYENIYQSMLHQSYWDQVSNSSTGSTNRDVALSSVMDLAVETEVIYQEAIKAGYTLTEEETADVNEKVTKLLTETLTKKQIKKTGFNEENLTASLTKEAIVTKFQNDKVDSFDIDDEAIKATVDYETYRQYDTEYFFISTLVTDSEGNSTEMTVNEKNAAKEKLAAFVEANKDAEDWSKILGEDETELKYNTMNFITGESGFTTDMETLIKSLNNGETTSEICTTDNGFYYIRMVDNNDSEKYDSQVESAIKQEENAEYSAYYEDVLKNYDYSITSKNLTSIKMGTVTLE